MLHAPSIVFNLDDFSEAMMTKENWAPILELKRRFPALKITMYTIPLQCSEEWLKWVKKNYNWLELHYHGTDHRDPNEWFDKEDFVLPFPDLFYRGFKAPWYKMNQKTANRFNKLDYLISAKHNWYEITGPKVYRFNLGKEIMKDVCYDRGFIRAIHSHVQPMKQKVGLPDIFNLIVQMIHSPRFLFVSDLLKLPGVITGA